MALDDQAARRVLHDLTVAARQADEVDFYSRRQQPWSAVSDTYGFISGDAPGIISLGWDD